ncbi:GNAT family N-acetyltransferase, partial [Candidatus Woesebacteria bacterium]|nr:GNAT family N-acetyltransferase [Candidatus Woesebacteria bacterium]
MSNLKFIPIEGEPSPEDKQVMVDGMLAYHASNGHPRKVDTHSILIKDDSNTLIGCVIVTFLYNGMEIATLWVDEKARGQGLGQKLMEMAEAEGKKRGATLAYTNTFTWQAPGFYEKIGYQLYGKLDDFPVGNT